jgi:uncharacterized protein (DUF2384 family)
MGINQNSEDIEAVWEEILDYFEGSHAKAILWLGTINVSLGTRKPIEYITEGRARIILDYILEARKAMVQ